MKTKIFTVGFLTALAGMTLILGLASFRPQTATPNYATMLAHESVGFDRKIVIIYENGSTEEIALESPAKQSQILSNATKIHETINMMSHKGYRVVTATKEHYYGYYLFEKK